MTGLTHQLEALQRIAASSARVRGHLQPEMDGLAVSEERGERAAQVA